MSEKPRSRIRPGHGAMSIFVLLGLPFDLISMTPLEALVTRMVKMFVKAFLLGGWYETQREILVDRFVPEKFEQGDWHRCKVAVVDGLWLATFSTVIYTSLILVQHLHPPEKSLALSAVNIVLNAVGCLVLGGPFLGIMLEFLQKVWVWGRGRGPRGLLKDGFEALYNLIKSL